MIFVQQAGKNRHEDIMESLEIFGTEVLPEFIERDEEQAADKAKRLAPVVERVLGRKERVLVTSTATRSRRCRGSGPTTPALKR